MSVRTNIADGRGSNRETIVTPDHALLVSGTTRSAADTPVEELTRLKLFSEYLRRLSDNASGMNVDGSVTPQEFVLASVAGYTRWITHLRVFVEGNNFDTTISGDFRRWGAVAASPGLANGTELFVEQGGVTTDIFYDPVKTMGDLFDYEDAFVNFSNAVTATADYLSIDFVPAVPIVLPSGNIDRIVARVNDNLVNANFLRFEILARGYQEIL